MSQTAIFAQPIRGEVTAEGRLLNADSKLLALHFAAGGEEGGLLAVPGLLTLAQQCARLGVGLSRDVILSDGENAQQLWAETRLEGGVVQLSILSMRAIDIRESDEARFAHIDIIKGHFAIETDTRGHIIALNGDFPPAFDFLFIGRKLSDAVVFTEDKLSEWEAAFAAERSYMAADINLVDIDGVYNLTARPAFVGDGTLSGYFVELHPAEDGAQAASAEGQLRGEGERFFGQKLAPALRQPLGRIIANAETIGAKLKGPLRDNYAVYAKDISDAAKHLVSLVDDLGDLEAVERPGFETAKEPVDLGDVARRIAGLLALKAADHQIRIILPDEAQKVVAIAEFRRVLQILLNVVNNAIRYSPDGTSIKIEIAELNGTACITVCDEGSGVDPENREKIFEKFERLGRSGDGGSGLGLYISRRLARAMDGDLEVSEHRGGGACFALTLPAASKG